MSAKSYLNLFNAINQAKVKIFKIKIFFFISFHQRIICLLQTKAGFPIMG